MKILLPKVYGQIAVFAENAVAQVENDNKATGVRARKASLAIEKQLKEFRKISIAEAKK